MKLPIMAGLLLCASSTLFAADAQVNLANGEKLHRSCAFCHGTLSQGVLGGWYPRLAGQSANYLAKQLRDFQKGDRNYHAMTVVSGIMHLSQQDVTDIAEYLAEIDLKKAANFNVAFKLGQANPESGAELYKDDCKSCHGRSGEGKDSKDSPMLAGQYPEYLLKQITDFKAKKRHHDNDPEDQTFDDYSQQELNDILSFIATLDD